MKFEKVKRENNIQKKFLNYDFYAIVGIYFKLKKVRWLLHVRRKSSRSTVSLKKKEL